MQRLVANLIRRDRDHVGRTARSSATSPTSTRCAGRPRPAFRPSTYVEGELSGLAYDRGLAERPGHGVPEPARAVRGPAVRRRRCAPRGSTVPTRNACVHRRGTRRRAQLLTYRALPADGDADPARRTRRRTTSWPRCCSRGSAPASAAGGIYRRRRRRGPLTAAPELRDPPAAQRRLRSRSQRPHDSPRDVVTTLQGMAGNPDFVARSSVAGETGTLELGLQRYRRAGSLPRQDRDAARCRQPGRLLHRPRRPHARVRVPDELGRSDHGARDRGSDDVAWRSKRLSRRSADERRLQPASSRLNRSSSARSPSSPSTATPSRSALASFEPGLSPATT